MSLVERAVALVPARCRPIVHRARFRLVHGGRRRTFRRIHDRNYWNDAESISGQGSSTLQTVLLVRELPGLLEEVGVRSLLDLPCGDFAWMARVDRSRFTYIGGDIVPELIERNRRLHGDARTTFDVIDLVVDDLPAADVVLVRDCLVHLSPALVWCALGRLRRSGSRYLLTTTYPGRGADPGVATGRWRPIDLEAPPYSFPAPQYTLLEGCTEHGGTRADKTLALWPMAAVPAPPWRARCHPRWLLARAARGAKRVRRARA